MRDKIVSIIKSLENTMNERLNKQDEMLGQLIKMVADNRSRLERIENSANRIEHNEPDDFYEQVDIFLGVTVNGTLA